MRNNNIENIYANVDTILCVFNQHFPDIGADLIDNLHDVHDIPEIGDAILQEERDDISKVVSILKSKPDLSKEEKALLAEAKSLLADIECKITYISGSNRTNASHSIIFDFDSLRALSLDPSYHHCLDFSFKKIKELFKSRLGTRPGTVIYNDTLNSLMSTYYFTTIMDDMDDHSKEVVCELIFDIARNINQKACEYLASKDPVFAKFINNTPA